VDLNLILKCPNGSFIKANARSTKDPVSSSQGYNNNLERKLFHLCLFGLKKKFLRLAVRGSQMQSAQTRISLKYAFCNGHVSNFCVGNQIIIWYKCLTKLWSVCKSVLTLSSCMFRTACGHLITVHFGPL